MRSKKDIDLEALRGKAFGVEAVAEITGLSPASIRRKIQANALPARKVPGDRGYTIIGSELADYLMGKPINFTRRKVETTGQAEPASTPAGSQSADPYKLPKQANARFKAWFEAQGVMIKDIANRTGLGADKLSRIINGKRSITRATLEKLERVYGKSLIHYLRTGERSGEI